MSAVGLAIPLIVTAPGLVYALKPFLKNNNYQPSRVKKTLGRLQKQELISIKEEGENIRIELLEKGKKKVLSYKLEDLCIGQEKWDGNWRVVIFDIPEKKKKARDFLRMKLKELGFFTLQKSVLVTPWECRDVVDFIKNYYFVSENVSLITAKSIDQEENLKLYFNLP